MNRTLSALLATLLLLLAPAVVSAQNSTNIEVKDGKVYVNGEFVKELENAKSGVYFLDEDEDGAVGFVRSANHDLHAFGSLRDHAMRLSEEAIVSSNGVDNLLFGSLRPNYMDRDILRLESSSRDLAQQLRMNPDNADELEGELRSVLADIFDRKLDLQQERVAELREELQSLETRLDERRNARSQVIERRLQELSGRKDVLDW